MLKQVAMEHINEQRRKVGSLPSASNSLLSQLSEPFSSTPPDKQGELMEQLELEKATRSTRPRESEEILRRDLERRRRQVDELSEEVSDLRLRLESQAVAHNFQVETKMSVFASMQVLSMAAPLHFLQPALSQQLLSFLPWSHTAISCYRSKQ